MFRLLIAAAVAVGAWVLLRQTRKPGGPPTGGGRRHNKTDTLMVIQLVGGKPTITRGPETLTPKKRRRHQAHLACTERDGSRAGDFRPQFPEETEA